MVVYKYYFMVVYKNYGGSISYIYMVVGLQLGKYTYATTVSVGTA